VTGAILSIQSQVAYGHVGNSAAVFPLQRMGIEVWPVNTVQFSNHTGYGAWRGHVHTPEQIDAIVDGIAERGVLGRCRALLSGYLGTDLLGSSVLRALDLVRAARPDALYLCDPVIGDDGRGVFVRPEIPDFFRTRAVPRADVITPNRFELEMLADRPVDSLPATLEAAAALRALGPRLVAVTSLTLPDLGDEMAVLLDLADGSWLVRTPRLPLEVNGGGDTFSALLLGNLLTGGAPEEVLVRTVGAMFAVMEATAEAGARELRLVAAQDAFADPPLRFLAVRVR
jgi:pyridoxine kinase